MTQLPSTRGNPVEPKPVVDADPVKGIVAKSAEAARMIVLPDGQHFGIRQALVVTGQPGDRITVNVERNGVLVDTMTYESMVAAGEKRALARVFLIPELGRKPA